MTIAELKHILAQCKEDSEVLIRLDDEFFENPQGMIAEIIGHEYSYGCTDTLALMLECAQPGSQSRADPNASEEYCPYCAGNKLVCDTCLSPLKQCVCPYKSMEDVLLVVCPACQGTGREPEPEPKPEPGQ
jgi:hypothetical protein